jgi:hypothetical protein
MLSSTDFAFRLPFHPRSMPFTNRPLSRTRKAILPKQLRQAYLDTSTAQCDRVVDVRFHFRFRFPPFD